MSILINVVCDASKFLKDNFYPRYGVNLIWIRFMLSGLRNSSTVKMCAE
ncbi:hypothetical protein X975_12464, partial [Stegodyphus mimosarum]